MAQRGGAVQSHLRISSKPIYSDLVPKGEADMLLSVEPMETLRYFDYLAPDGVVVASSSPFVNIPNYPDLEDVLAQIKTVERLVLVDSEELAKEAGFARAQNMVMLGAASPHLMLKEEDLKGYIKDLFEPRGEKLVDINLKAFQLGHDAALQQ